MEPRYSAFISYRHHPDDIRVASEIHRSLEHFRIPSALRKNKKRISPIFRDKEELPITSNLNDDIGTALKKSDYLIVICSIHTKESIWVQREIDLFLQTHDRNHVLTVLASGEPYDVIPECLLYEDIFDPDTGKTTRVEYEPLSCDWRMPRRKAKREELPRLAAVLLGCSYDELRQRQKQYRTRRATAIISTAFAALLCLTAYFIYTTIKIRNANIQIEKNLNTALLNQSNHLSTAANQSLAEGDRLTAITLAMAALPSGENDRPYLPAAEKSLTTALNLYTTENAGYYAAGAISMGEGITIRDFWVSKDSQYIYVFDSRNILSCWDADSFSRLGLSDPIPDSISDLFISAEGNAVFNSHDTAYCVAPNGTVLWKAENHTNIYPLSDKRTLLALDTADQLTFISTADGTTLRDPIALPSSSSTSGNITYLSIWAQDYAPGLPIPIIYVQEESNPLTGFSISKSYKILLVDPENNATSTLSSDAKTIELVTVTPDGKLLFTADEQCESSLSGQFDDNRINSPTHRDLYCYDTNTQSLLWKQSLSSYTSVGIGSLTPIPNSERVLCQFSTSLYVLDTNTGAILTHCEASSSIQTMIVEEKRAQAILQDGYICNFVYDGHYCYEEKCMTSPLWNAAIGKDYYGYLRFSTQLIAYRKCQANPAWEYTFEEYISKAKNVHIFENLLAFQTSSNLYLFDLESKELISTFNIPSLKFLGINDTGSKLWCISDLQDLVTIDIATNATETVALPTIEAESQSARLHSFTARNGILTYLITIGEETKLVCFDLNKQEMIPSEPIQLLNTTDSPANYTIVTHTAQYVWIWVSDGRLLELDLSSQKVSTVSDLLTSCPQITIRDDETAIIVTCPNNTFTKKPGSPQTVPFVPENASAFSSCFYGEEILLLCDDGSLYRYDAGGTLLSQIQLEVSDDFANYIHSSDPVQTQWHFTEHGRLIVTACKTANIIDCQQWDVCSYVSNCIAYDPTGSNFICHFESRIMGFPTYSIPQLLQIAEAQLNGFRLTQAQRESYGLD